MKRNILVIVLLGVLGFSACRSNKCNCPHWEKEKTSKAQHQ